ncbi:probable calcium-binding protein CML20 [Hordeum vulgare subsp. vulgare]|uniref:EF-hand domain-containing protein n=1 Tax=Hordeum vulgare subsp. vulgare TaxID=112509 RepID=A0A8I6YF40_HORVV|nr:probable calcium-binding protein CML20 [Hordeum vulgare subsp. vulgare]
MGQAVSAASSSFRRKSRAPSPVPQATAPPAAKDHDPELVRIFRRYDTDGDGRISAAEIREIWGCTDAEAQEMVAEADSNGDGLISIEELGALLKDGGSEDLPTAFAVFDENGDGVITPKELRRAFRMPLLGGEEHTIEECFRMVAAFDQDGDGVLSFDEFKAMMAPKSA